MMHVLRPSDEADLSSMLAEAASLIMPLEILGNGTKRDIGRPVEAQIRLSTDRLTGIKLYEPTELVLSALAGTPVSLLEETLAENNQMLAFEPIDLGPIMGKIPGQTSIGGVFASNFSGSRRLAAGSARDHLIGIRAFNGEGTGFCSGGRVMKNVTGYDLARGLSGSWGTLAVMSEVTMKVMPAPEESRTLLLRGLNAEIAADTMCAAISSPFEISSAVHFEQPFIQTLRDEMLKEEDQALTAFRLESFSNFIPYRLERLKAVLAPYGEIEVMEDERSRLFWSDMRVLKFLWNDSDPVWRISTAPQNGPKILRSVKVHHPEARAVFDWSGGLLWLVMPPTSDAGAFDIRCAIAEYGGHSTLIRAELKVRKAVDNFQPLEARLTDLTKKIKASFDPQGILNYERMYRDV